MFNPSASRSDIAAMTVAAIMAAALCTAEASAAWRGHGGTAQHAAPFHAAPFLHAAPMFRPAPMRRAPPSWAGGNRPMRAMPFASPQNAVQALDPYRAHPALPLNNPHMLRPNFPSRAEGLHAPGAPGGGSTLAPNHPNPVRQGSVAPSPGANALKAGAGQLPSRPPVSQPFTMRPPVTYHVVLRPLMKAPPGGFTLARPAFPVVQRNSRFWPLIKDRKFMWMHGKRHAFVPLATLGVVLIDDSYWYPDGYVSMEGPACSGETDDGCQLEWQDVDFEDGGAEPQCVEYCPQAGPPPDQAGPPPDQAGPPPDQVATLPPPPPLEQDGACQTTIYSEPNFAGNSAPTGDSQPILSTTGWRNEIASIVVAAGTWDFFADENFGGESLRLMPGTYAKLPPEWTRHIGSFMCVEPGPPPT